MPNPKILGIDEIFEERGNEFSRFEKVKWGDDSDKSYLDVRRYKMNENNEEIALKGMTFLTEDGPKELAKAIIRTGFGETEEYLEELYKRDDFSKALNSIVGKDSPHYDESIPEDKYYDAKEFING